MREFFFLISTNFYLKELRLSDTRLLNVALNDLGFDSSHGRKERAPIFDS